jgi:hypothetical protein
MDSLFGDIPEMSAFDDFSSAPTPLMSACFATLDDIESDDLLDYNSNENGSSGITATVDTIDLQFVDNEVEIGVNTLAEFEGQVFGEMPVPNETNLYRPQHSREQIPCKRIKTSNYANQFPDSEEEDDEDFEVEAQPKRKSKVGRKPSKGQNKCMTRNAIAARENRERKKAYIEDMEKKLHISEGENRKMRSIITALTKKNEELSDENKYYKGVLANDSKMSQVIKHLAEVSQIELIGTQMIATKGNHSVEVTVDSKTRKSTRIASKAETQTNGYRLKNDTDSSGICLHVNNNEVSLEFCAKCSIKQKKAK